MEKTLTTEEMLDGFFESLRKIAIGVIVGSFIFACSFLIWDREAFAEDAAPATPKTLFGDVLADAHISVSGGTAFYTNYVWRGFKLDDDSVLQPTITLSAFNGFSLNIWSNFDLENEDPLASNETDTTVSYSHSFEELSEGMKPVTVSVGHTYYEFMGTDTFSREFYVALGYGCLLNPTLTYYHDYGREASGGGHGDYVSLALNQSFPIIPDYGVTFDLSGHVGYNKKLYMTGVGGDVLVSAGVTVPLTANLKVQPNVNYSKPLDDLRDNAFADQSDALFSGVAFTYNM